MQALQNSVNRYGNKYKQVLCEGKRLNTSRTQSRLRFDRKMKANYSKVKVEGIEETREIRMPSVPQIGCLMANPRHHTSEQLCLVFQLGARGAGN